MEAGALTGKLLNVRRLTGGTLASPSTYTPTTGTKAIIVEVVGGGGGGGGANLVASAGLNTVGAGGGGGGYAKAFKVISFGEVFTYYAPVTGTGGTAGGITGTDGTAGETASFMCSVGSGSVTGTGGGFDYYTLDKQLFDNDGLINKSCKFVDLASYIFFIETRLILDKNNINNFYIGSHMNTEFYLIFDNDGPSIIDNEFINTLDKQKQKIIYAKKCIVDDDVLEENNVVFKQIPYDIRHF